MINVQKKIIPSGPNALVDTIFKVNGAKLNPEDVDKLKGVLRKIPIKEGMIIKMRFGLDDDISRTYAEIGQKFDVTEGRIRQIKERAIRKLRHPSRSQELVYLIRGLPDAK